ncbi:MAG: hypothetical protein RL748_3787 [Pseudomonadota bacterium]|jgi:uncharacterized RDD family membrane protein YckC
MSTPDQPHNPYQAPESDVFDSNGKGYEIAGRGTRLGAALIDGVIIMAIIFIPAIIILGGWAAYMEKTQSGGLLLNLIMGLAGFVTYVVVNGVFLAANGQTIGKKLLGIKIVRTDGSPADFQRIIFRRLAPIQVAGMIPFIGWIVSLVDGLLIFRESNQCLHDTIADTIVIVA